ncbi:MAG: PKD domain-containing protein [Lewinella sp.]|nr:PKD domain-containing protein [Lewinella sp.]
MTLTHSASACPASYSSTVTVLPPPTVSLTADQLSGCPPLDVCFSSEVTGASFLEWDFGDGNHSTNLNPCHSFFASGQYRVTLRGADEQGCFSRPDTVQVHVFPEPVAGFVLPEEVYCGSPQAITFTNTSTQATAYDWSFGNGVNSTLTSPAVTYTEPGSYTVYLQASNTFGCTDETEAALQIVPQPLADFFPIMIEPCAPQQVVFDNASVDADAFWWSLGDGVESIAANPVLTYDSAGWYDVTLVAGQQGLCFDTLTLYGAVELFPRPQAAFSWEVPAGQYQGLIQFMNESVGAVGYDWDFGDGATSAEVDPLHDYALNGSWVAELIATAANGCTDTAAVAVEPETMYGLFFPNAFSPESGEGEVRVFKPAGTGLVSWSLEIFSPWGQRVFRGDEINGDRPAVAWDGHYQGKLLPQGAYAYKATAEYVNGIRKIYTGSVTLLR